MTGLSEQWTGPSLTFCTKTAHEPMWTYHQHGLWQSFLVNPDIARFMGPTWPREPCYLGMFTWILKTSIPKMFLKFTHLTSQRHPQGPRNQYFTEIYFPRKVSWEAGPKWYHEFHSCSWYMIPVIFEHTFSDESLGMFTSGLPNHIMCDAGPLCFID